MAALLAVVAGLVLAAVITRTLCLTDVFLLRSASALYAKYGGDVRRQGSLPADNLPINATSEKELRRLFESFYVVKDGATDCSFVAALMLVLRRDPSYPFRVVQRAADGYVVRFPAFPTPILVTGEDLRQHHRNWEKTRDAYHWIWRGHIPEGLEILRCAYYNYQALVRIRGSKGAVHGGGWPAQDLIVLSGVRESRSLSAYCPDLGEEASFATCPAVSLITRLGEDGTFSSSVTGPPHVVDDPLESLGDPDSHLIVLSSSGHVPRCWGLRLVPDHAYYYLGRTESGGYVLGNSYQTRQPVIVTAAQLGQYFRGVDYVDLAEDAPNSIQPPGEMRLPSRPR